MTHWLIKAATAALVALPSIALPSLAMALEGPELFPGESALYEQAKKEGTKKPRVFVRDFEGDIKEWFWALKVTPKKSSVLLFIVVLLAILVSCLFLI